MTTCTDDDDLIQALFTVRRGDAWVFAVDQTDDEDLSGWDDDVLVQIRTRPNEAGTMVASSNADDEDDDVALIDTTGTAFGDGDSVFRFTMEDSDKIPAGDYWLEASTLRDGLPFTVIPGPTQAPRRFRVLPQVAVGVSGS